MKIEKLNSEGLTTAEAVAKTVDAARKARVIQDVQDFFQEIIDDNKGPVKITLQSGDRYFPQIMAIMSNVWELMDWFFTTANKLGIYPKRGSGHFDYDEEFTFEYFPDGRPEL